jgi:hypothetical protein
VVTIRASEYQRSVAVGAFGRSFDKVCDTPLLARGIKAVWRNETGTAHCPSQKVVPV